MTARLPRIAGPDGPSRRELAQRIAKLEGRVRRLTKALEILTGVKAADLKEPVRDVVERVALRCQVGVGDMLSNNRQPEVCAARWEAWAALHSTGMSISAIARTFQRDHTTVLHGLAQHKRRAEG